MVEMILLASNVKQILEGPLCNSKGYVVKWKR